MAEKVKIIIDDKEYEVEKGKTVLQAALENGIDIPYFCYHPKLSIAGACRMCVVYWENINRLVISCNTPVQDGMVIRTHHTSEQVKENQKYLLQALMTRHPLDCPICDKAGECDLQNFGAIYGPQRQVVPISALEKEREEHSWESDFLEYYSNRCVVCYRCTRACDEIVGAHALYVESRGFESNIIPTVRPMDTSTCEMCGICVYVCPVGAIISKPFKYWSRSWLLQKELTRCNLCPVGCEIQIEFGVGDWRSKRKVYRTKPTEELNICAKAFFGYDALNVDRLLKPYAHGREESPGNLVNLLSSVLGVHERETAFILSGYIPNEIIDSVLTIAKATNSYITAPQTADFFKIAQAFGDYHPPTIEEVQNADFYAFVGEDITSTATVLTYYTKGKVYRVGKALRDEKFEPEEIELEDIEKLQGTGVIVVGTTAFGGEEARKLGEKLKTLADKGHKVLLLPKDGNVYGIYQRIKDIYSDIDAVVQAVLEGRINTLVIFGEDITEYYDPETVEQMAEKLEHLIVASPYDFGLSVRATMKVPMALMGESNGTFTTLFGEVKGRKFLPWAFDDISFWNNLADAFRDKEGEVKVLRGNTYPPKKPQVHIYRNSWITSRSENLTKLYEKNKLVSEYKV
ncbi:MAG: 2Fe-2S iron-sulfur cluster binding domain-containing protein [Aquificae bacterium]|nr:2Fe-2S iron-sulfur cluster binding domain-containing protein [Aquificota bacterium]